MENTSIKEQEIIDREIVKNTFSKLLKVVGVTDFVFTPKEVTHPYDAEVKYDLNGKEHTVCVEIKYYNQVEFLVDRPCFQLKEEKLHRVLDSSGENTVLLFLVYKDKVYIYNPKEMDWDHIFCYNKVQKVIQYCENSPLNKYPTYLIPLEMASYICALQ